MKKFIAYVNAICVLSNDGFIMFKLENIETACALLNTMSEKKSGIETVNRFVMAYRAYREGKININNETLVQCIYDVASFCVGAVLKKIDMSTCNDLIHSYRFEHDLKTLADLKYCIENATETKYNTKGEQYTKIIDNDLYAGIKDNIQTFGEKQLMIENTVSYLLEYCKNMTLTDIRFCKKNSAGIEKNFMTRLGKHKHPSKHVYCTDFLGFNECFGGVITDSEKIREKNGVASVKMIDEKINLLQLLCKKVREYIYSNDSITALEKNYVYLDKKVTDENGCVIECQERQFKCNPFKNKVIATAENTKIYTDKNGIQKIRIKKDAKTDKEIFIETVEKLKLTDIQKKVLAMRIYYGGAYGYKAIATALKMSNDTVKSALKYIRKKAVDAKIVPATIDYMTDENTPIETTFNIPVSESDKIEYALSFIQYRIPYENIDGEYMRYSALGFNCNNNFDSVDISIICDKNNPTAKSENVENGAQVISAENVNPHRITIIDSACRIPSLKTTVSDITDTMTVPAPPAIEISKTDIHEKIKKIYTAEKPHDRTKYTACKFEKIKVDVKRDVPNYEIDSEKMTVKIIPPSMHTVTEYMLSKNKNR